MNRSIANNEISHTESEPKRLVSRKERRELERKADKKADKKVKTIREPQPKVNAYTCMSLQKHPDTVIKHRDPGTAPMFIKCVECDANAISHMYKVPQDLDYQLTAFKPKSKTEWKIYRNYLEEFYKKVWPEHTQKDIYEAVISSKVHVNKGGVLLIDKSIIPAE